MRFEYNEKTHIYEPIHEIIWVDLLESNVVEISSKNCLISSNSRLTVGLNIED